MSKVNYEAEVKKVYADAVKQKHGTLCYIQNGRDGDAIGYSVNSFKNAWLDAYLTLKQQGKL